MAVTHRTTGPGSGNINFEPPTRLAVRLQSLRLHAGLSQKQLAPFVGAAARISDWELGIHQPTLTVLRRYADYFDMTVAELLDGVM